MSLQISGHSGSAERGKDLICAGVSSISIGCLNALDIMANDDCDLTLGENLVKIEVKKINHDSQIILQSVLIQLRTMQEKYSNFITIENMEVKT